MENDKVRNIPTKNYLILILVLLITAGLVYYFYLWYMTYKDSKLNEPILDRYLEVINYDELSDYITENRNAIIYVSVLENEEIRNFEIKFRSIIVKNFLNEKLLYMDMTDVFSDKIKLTELRNTYQANGYNISDVPCILVFEDTKLIDVYSISEHSYDIEDILDYLEDKEMLIK